MTDPRQAMQMALEALHIADFSSGFGHMKQRQAVDALRAALSAGQGPVVAPNQVAINAWKLRMVFFDEDDNITMHREPEAEELARFANSAQQEQALLWASRLAESLARKHYPEAPHFQPLPDLVGVISQIDNMTCGLTRAAPTVQPLTDEQRQSLHRELRVLGYTTNSQTAEVIDVCMAAFERAHGIGGPNAS